jgi:hypothetical membrane protein
METTINNGRQKSPLKIGGLLAFIAGLVIFMGIITGEIYYPEGYNTAINDISDLGSTRPDSIIHQPSATIFITSMLIAGLLLCISNCFVYNFFRKWLFTIAYVLFAIGVLGVGVFPGNIDPYHGIFSLLTFVSGSFTCILSASIIKQPYSFVGIPIGIAFLGQWRNGTLGGLAYSYSAHRIRSLYDGNVGKNR